MASNGTSDSCTLQKKLQKKSTREFYFHIRGGTRLNIRRADTDPLWKDVPRMVSPEKIYYTVQCDETTTLQEERRINDREIHSLKDKLKKFIKEVEIHQMSLSFRYEARFGRLFFVHTDDQTKCNPVTTHLLKEKSFKKEFVTRLLSQCNIEVFKQEHCEMTMNSDEITYKIRFKQYGEDLDKGEFSGVCYIEERAGSFTLLSVHNSNGHTNEMKIDIIRPGGTYDIRVASGVHNYNEEEVPNCVKIAAEKIAKSMIRSTFNPEEIRLQIVGDSENYWVDYIRETKQQEFKWKKDPRWILVEQNVRDLKYTKENCRILKRDGQFRPVPITFDQSESQTQIELWTNLHSQPNGISCWTTEQMLAGFDEFVGTCFDIVGLLDDMTA